MQHGPQRLMDLRDQRRRLAFAFSNETVIYQAPVGVIREGGRVTREGVQGSVHRSTSELSA